MYSIRKEWEPQQFSKTEMTVESWPPPTAEEAFQMEGTKKGQGKKTSVLPQATPQHGKGWLMG